MELIKEAGEHKIYKKRKKGKYAIQDSKGKFINGAEKVKLLQQHGVVKTLKAKAKAAPEAAADAPKAE